jgi:hypothetical protein
MNQSAIKPALGDTIGRLKRHAEALLGVVIVALLCGCSSFNREWKAAGKSPMPTNSITGRWEGRWLSHENGHNGALRCLINESSEGSYEAYFRATYLKVARFSYKVPLMVTSSNDGWHFTGEENLGVMAGGIYRYVGSASVTNFDSTYRSKHDHGVFLMTRPQQP